MPCNSVGRKITTSITVELEQFKWIEEHDNGSEAVRDAIDYYMENEE